MQELIDIIKEKHPKIGKRLELIWGSPEASKYLDSIMISDRNFRMGFSVEVFDALLKLRVMCNDIDTATGPW